MNNSKGPAGRRRGSASYNKNTIRLNSSISDRRRAKKQSRAAAHAEYLSTLPKERWKRLLYRLQPKRVAAYWFSREGGIMALKLIGIGILVCFFLTVGLFAYFRKDLPKIKDISGSNIGGSNTYYDRTGQTVLWQDYDAVKRIPVTSDNISPYLKNATIAIEDKNFYNEGAFDVRGIMRAAITDVSGKGGLQGGSTITQQLVKLNQNWTNDRTISRKVKELILAVELEREYSKDDILTGYLNIAPYGGIEYGAESAARDYFHTDAKSLTLEQATLLAAIPKAPGKFSPYSSTRFNKSASGTFDQDALIGRQHYILDLMVTQGKITKAQADAAKKVDVVAQVQPLTSKYSNIKAPYFVLAAKQELQAKYGTTLVSRGGWKIITTLDMDLQNSAESLAAKNLANVKRFGGDTEAMAAEDVKTGQMVALVGGQTFNDPTSDHGELNYAQLNISPGSSFKPYDYATFIENHTNAGAGSVLYDVQAPIAGTTYTCTNKAKPTDGGNCLTDYDFRYPGALSLRYALAGSRNVPAVKAMLSAVQNDKSKEHITSINKTISTANAMMGNDNAYKCYKTGTDVLAGTKADQKQCFGSSAIGDGAYIHLDEHINGLSTLARMGQQIPQTYILQITDSADKTFLKWTQPKPKQVIRPDTAYIVNNMLSDPKATYLSQQYKMQDYNGWKVAIKTGTTNDNFDGLMTAWTTKYAIASWVGYHTRTKAMTAGHMEAMTAPLTQSWMKDALNKAGKPVNWDQPADIKMVNAYVQRAHAGNSSIEPGPTQEIFPAWYVPKAGAASSSAVIDKVSGGLATSCTPAAAKQTVGGANDNSFSVDEFYPPGGSTSAGGAATTSTDTVHNCSDSPPSMELSVPANCTAIDNGGQGCAITVGVGQGTHPLGDGSRSGTVTISVNGNQISSQNVTDASGNVTVYYKPTTDGPATISATVTDSVLYQTTKTASTTLVSGQPLGMTNRPNANLTSFRKSQQTTTSGGAGDNNQKKGKNRAPNQR